MIQTALFPTAKIGQSFEKADAEYKQLISKGASVRLVKIIKEETYTACFFSKQMIEGKLKSIYKLIK